MWCGTDCNLGALNAAWFVVWGGAGNTLVVMVVGTVWSVVTRRHAFYWPLMSFVVTVLCFSVGLLLLEQVDPN